MDLSYFSKNYFNISNIHTRPIRQSNYELLRLIMMIFIFTGHFMGQSQALEVQSGFNLYFSYMIGSAARISVNTFLILGCFFMVDTPFKTERVLKIWFQTLFYGVTISVIIYFLFPDIAKIKHIKQACFPIWNFNKSHWFISVYLTLMLLAPFIKCLYQFEEPYLKKFNIVLFIFIPLWCTTHRSEDNYMDCLGWFLFIFIFMTYAKKYLLNKLHGKWIYLLIAACIYILLFLVVWLNQFLNQSGIQNSFIAGLTKTFSFYLSDYKTLPNFIAAFFIFVFFSKLNMKPNLFINYFASSTLAVYIIHQTTALIPVLWNNILHADYFIHKTIWPLYVITTTISFFVIITFLDKLRIKYIENTLLRRNLFQYIIKKIDHFYKDL